MTVSVKKFIKITDFTKYSYYQKYSLRQEMFVIKGCFFLVCVL